MIGICSVLTKVRRVGNKRSDSFHLADGYGSEGMLHNSLKQGIVESVKLSCAAETFL